MRRLLGRAKATKQHAWAYACTKGAHAYSSVSVASGSEYVARCFSTMLCSADRCAACLVIVSVPSTISIIISLC